MIDKALIQPYIQRLSPIPTQAKSKGGLDTPIKCLLCDLYGTLFISSSGDIGLANSQRQQSALLDKLLVRYHLKTSARELRLQLARTIKDQHAQSRTNGIEYPEVVIENVWQQLLPIKKIDTIRRFAVEFEMITNPVWPMPGLKALLSTCRSNGISLGIISNAQFYTHLLFHWFLDHAPEDLGFDPELTIYSYQIAEAKPSPTLFNMAHQRLTQMDIAPSSVAYIGNDMRKDIVPAHMAGFQSILFAGDRRSLRLLDKSSTHRQTIEPDMVVTHLEQLSSYLQGHS